MKRSLGLFHFNVQYVAGNLDGYHRYCQQAVAPFLQAVAANPEWRVSFEMAGNGLEFLGHFYPSLLRKLRELIGRGQVELISSTYCPTLWVAFPRRDLIRSVRLNRLCLQRLDLPVSRIFFAQEAFFGLGLANLKDFFDAAICKDDYLDHFLAAGRSAAAYRLGELKVIVGSNHLRNELARRMRKQWEPAPAWAEPNRWCIQDMKTIPELPAALLRTADGSEWEWYHLGSGHHLATWAVPGDGDNFVADRQWMRMTRNLISSYFGEGRQFATLQELTEALDAQALPEFPCLPEGGWNSVSSDGVFRWMGCHRNPWENDPGILGQAWRTRNDLARMEERIASLREEALRAALNRRIERAWKRQVLAESSDPLGWDPLAREVQFGRRTVHSVARVVSVIAEKLTAAGDEVPADEWGVPEDHEGVTVACPAELFGAEGAVTATAFANGRQWIDAHFRVNEDVCGLRFPGLAETVTFCPSGAEESPVVLSLAGLRPERIFLPLANGLISWLPGSYLIRQNACGQPAACLDRKNGSVSFQVEGHTPGRMYRWCFVLFTGELADAVKLAAKLNHI